MRTRTIYIVATFAVLLLTACNNGGDSNRSQSIAIPVSVSDVENGNIQKFNSTTGNVIPYAQARITALINGEYQPALNKRTNSKYKIGDRVNSDDIVARLEDKEYENTTAVETKRINLEIAKGELEKLIILEKKGGATKTEIRNAELSVSNANTEYENGKIALEKMSITSPINGTIVNIEHHTPGVIINSGSAIMDVMDYSKLLLNVALSESSMNSVKKGQEVYITHYSLPNDTIKASINELSPVIDTETRTYKGVILINNNDLKLKPGMFVKADVVVDQALESVVIPKDVIRTIGGRSVVFVADGTTARQRNIEIGIENNDMIQVKGGLSKGDKLITSGYETLRNNSKIRIIK